MADAVGALEEQLNALQTTQADMRSLRSHMAGLEDELEQLSTANGGLQRELDRKAKLVERHSKRAAIRAALSSSRKARMAPTLPRLLLPAMRSRIFRQRQKAVSIWQR